MKNYTKRVETSCLGSGADCMMRKIFDYIFCSQNIVLHLLINLNCFVIKKGKVKVQYPKKGLKVTMF